MKQASRSLRKLVESRYELLLGNLIKMEGKVIRWAKRKEKLNKRLRTNLKIS